MKLVEDILNAEKETPIMIYSESEFIGKNIHLFGRFGDKVQSLNQDGVFKLVGDLYGVKNILYKGSFRPEIFQNDGDIWLPESANGDVTKFEYAVGIEDINKCAKSLKHWNTGMNIEARLNDQMCVARTFGKNRVYMTSIKEEDLNEVLLEKNLGGIKG